MNKNMHLLRDIWQIIDSVNSIGKPSAASQMTFDRYNKLMMRKIEKKRDAALIKARELQQQNRPISSNLSHFLKDYDIQSDHRIRKTE